MRPPIVFRSALALLFSFVLTSCSDLLKVPTVSRTARTKTSKIQKGSGQPGLGGLPPSASGAAAEYAKRKDNDTALGAELEDGGYLPPVVGEGVTAGGMVLPSDASIVWATDDPDADIPFDKPFSLKTSEKKGWLQSFDEARRKSIRSGKPLVIYFTTSKVLPGPKKRLEREVLSTNRFAEWAKENVVRLKVDMSGGSMEQGEIKGEASRKRTYAADLKKRYRVVGLPTVVVLHPDGSVYTKLRGFKRGGKSAYFTKLENAALTISHTHNIWKNKMMRKGYRDWTGKNGEVVFAKLQKFRNNRMILVEPDGSRFKTSTRGLSKPDRAWLIAEQEKRGL